MSHEVVTIQGPEREAFRGPGRDVEQESWLTPCCVLGGVDPELTTADPAQEHVRRTGDQLVLGKADWEAAITAASRHEEHHGAAGRLETIDRLQGGLSRIHPLGNDGRGHRV